MVQKHRQNGPLEAKRNRTGNTVEATNRHQIHVESIDGSIIQFSADGSESVAQIRERVLGQMNVETQRAGKYVMAVTESQNNEDIRIINDNATIDQIVSEGHKLDFQLIPQVAFGKKTGDKYAGSTVIKAWSFQGN